MVDDIVIKLRELLARHGDGILTDPLRLEAILLDYCPNRRKETRILATACKEGLPREIKSQKAVSSDIILSRHYRILIENYGFSKALAEWAVLTWAFAMDVRTDFKINDKAERHLPGGVNSSAPRPEVPPPPPLSSDPRPSPSLQAPLEPTRANSPVVKPIAYAMIIVVGLASLYFVASGILFNQPAVVPPNGTVTPPPDGTPASSPVVTISPAPQSRAEVVKSGIVLEYHFDGSTVDTSGNHHDGVNHGATYVAGINDQALDFNGVDNYVGIPDSNQFTLRQFTIEAVVRVDDKGDDYQHIISNTDINDRFKGYCLQYTRYDSGGNVANSNTFIYSLGIGNWINHIYSGKVKPNTWYYLVGTFDGSVQKLYLDGGLVGSSRPSVQFSKAVTDIGAMPGLINHFNGAIDEIRIYDRALSDSEIKTNYACMFNNGKIGS